MKSFANKLGKKKRNWQTFRCENENKMEKGKFIGQKKEKKSITNKITKYKEKQRK